MAIKGDKFEKMVNGIKHVMYPDHMKEQIVRELENGSLTLGEAMSKYEIRQLDTLKQWLKKYSRLTQEQYMRGRSNPATRSQAVREIDSGRLTLEEAAIKYHVTIDTIKDWLKVYSCDVIKPLKHQRMKQNVPAVTTDEKNLLQIIEEQKLKIAGLEAMIDVAEKELNIDIRKKSGTRQ
jgi:exonuclease VII small subunit